MQQLMIFSLYLIVLITTGCGLHLNKTSVVPLQMKMMVFDSDDPNDPLSQAIRNYLCLHNVKVIEKKHLCQNIPSLRILSSSLSREAVSVFQDGRTAEYQVILSVNAAVLVPSKDIYPISTKVYRLFLENPQLALAKDYERQLIISELYDQAAEQLISSFLSRMHKVFRKN